MPAPIRVTLTIDEENSPSLYQSISTISPRRRAKFLSNRLFLLFEAPSGKSVPISSTGMPPTHDIDTGLGSKAGAEENDGGTDTENTRGGMGFAEKLVSGAVDRPSA